MDAEKFWDNAADNYAKSAIGNEKVYEEKLSAIQKYLTADSTALEIGCGTGSTAIRLAPSLKHILATDISSSMLVIGRKKALDAGISNISFEHTAVENVNADPSTFDVVLALNILHLLDDPFSAISKAFTLLKPGGIFVSGTVCLGDVLINYYRVLIPIMRLLGKAPPVTYIKRRDIEACLAKAGFEIDYQRPPAKGEAAFIIATKPL